MSRTGAFVHDAFPYSTPEEFLGALVPFAIQGVRAGDAVVAVVGADNIGPLGAALADELGGSADAVDLIEAEAWYQRPAHTIAGYLDVLDRHDAAGRRVRVIGEVEFGSLPLEQREWIRYEAALNGILADRNAWVVCPYDTRRLPDDVLVSAGRTHPRIWRGPGPELSGTYTPPEQLLRDGVNTPLPESAVVVLSMRLTPELAALRASVHEASIAAGLDRLQVQQFVLALNEIATNALVHGRGGGTVRLWRHDHGLVAEITDRGPGLSDPFAGYRPPPGETSEGGFGLWLARQLTDTLEVVPSASGTTVRMGVLASLVSR